MKEVEFKVGDLVYIFGSNKIGTVREIVSEDCISVDNLSHWFNPSRLTHATQENYERLSATFPNIEFEPPPKRKEPREVIEAMLDNNYPFVLSSKENYALFLCNETNINEFNLDDYFIVSKETGQFIIDFADGEVVLESENANL